MRWLDFLPLMSGLAPDILTDDAWIVGAGYVTSYACDLGISSKLSRDFYRFLLKLPLLTFSMTMLVNRTVLVSI